MCVLFAHFQSLVETKRKAKQTKSISFTVNSMIFNLALAEEGP